MTTKQRIERLILDVLEASSSFCMDNAAERNALADALTVDLLGRFTIAAEGGLLVGAGEGVVNTLRCELDFGGEVAPGETVELQAYAARVENVSQRVSAVGLMRAEKLIVRNAEKSDLHIMIRCRGNSQFAPEVEAAWKRNDPDSGVSVRHFPDSSLSAGTRWDAVPADEIQICVRNSGKQSERFDATAFGRCLK